jgi:CDP-diacylglycerol--glycerol-3-phosphate 3-phosphatidyltransferase
MLEGLKPLLSATLRPLAAGLGRRGVHPNHVTLLGVALFCAAGWCAYAGSWRLSALLATAGGGMDALDGLLAREWGKQSVFGGVLDSVCDRVTEVVWFGGICAWFLVQESPLRFWGVMSSLGVITGSTLVSYVKARAEGAGLQCSTGFLQRPERIIAGIVLLLTNQTIMLWGLGALAFLAYGAAMQRLLFVRGQTQ